MLLHPDPSLAEVPGFTKEQLDALARSVELRRLQLEKDIHDYIKTKHDELRDYGQQLVDQYRSMECQNQLASARETSTSNAENIAAPLALQEQPAPPGPEPEEKTKQKKHTKVHKREKELYGLVTPVFLPLLDARDSSPEKKKKKLAPDSAHAANHATVLSAGAASRNAEQSKQGRKQRKDNKDVDVSAALGDVAGEKQPAEAGKKSKRAIMKKSALRHKDKPRTPRKRVSLVIDGQTVHPSDTVEEPPLTSPSSEATSASNSTASLDDMIDPRLTTCEPPVYLEHRDAVHHSLPLPMANAIRSATKAFSESQKPTSVSIAANHSPPLPSPRSPSIPFGSAQSATRTFLDPSPAQPPHSIPETAGPDPIYSSSFADAATAATAELEADDLDDKNQNFDTYVGGLHGSGVDDVDQAGSYGYPSSLGASYMESYMQNRPLSVRMQAASKAGLGEAEKRRLLEEEEEDDDNDDDDFGHDRVQAKNKGMDTGDDNFMGDMDDF